MKTVVLVRLVTMGGTVASAALVVKAASELYGPTPTALVALT